MFYQFNNFGYKHLMHRYFDLHKNLDRFLDSLLDTPKKKLIVLSQIDLKLDIPINNLV